MNNYDPAESIASAFVDLGKRVIAFFLCLLLGVMEGAVASLISGVFQKPIRGRQEASLPDEWYEEALPRVFDFPHLSLIAVGIVGCVLACLGMIKIMYGSSKLTAHLMVIIGGSLFALLFFQQLGWELSLMLWIALGGFMILNVVILKVWQKQERLKWESELERIAEENRDRRNQSMRVEPMKDDTLEGCD